MSYKTMTELVTDVEAALYQSAGPQVQIYSQSIITQMVQDAFDHFFLKRFWNQFRKREQRTLDGVTGQITAVPTFISDYHDLEHVFRENSDRPLPQLPHSLNTLNLSGATPKFIEASGDTKLFTVYPLTATGNVLLVGRRRPAQYAMEDVVEFDPLVLKHFAAWNYFCDDGANPASASKHQVLFEKRLKELELADEQHAVVLDPYATALPDQWYETH